MLCLLFFVWHPFGSDLMLFDLETLAGTNCLRCRVSEVSEVLFAAKYGPARSSSSRFLDLENLAGEDGPCCWVSEVFFTCSFLTLVIGLTAWVGKGMPGSSFKRFGVTNPDSFFIFFTRSSLFISFALCAAMANNVGT